MRREVVVCQGGCGAGGRQRSRGGLGFGVGARGLEIPAIGDGLGLGLVQWLLRDSGGELEVRECGCDFWCVLVA